MRRQIKSTVSCVTAAALLVGLAGALLPAAAQEDTRATRTITVEHWGEPASQGIILTDSEPLHVVRGDRIRVLIKRDVWCPEELETPSTYGGVVIEVKNSASANPTYPSCGFTRTSYTVSRSKAFGKDHYVVLGGRVNQVPCKNLIEITYVDDNCTTVSILPFSNKASIQIQGGD